MTKRLEDIKFSDSYSKKELLEAIECLQHNCKEYKKTYDRAVSVNYKLSEILKSCNVKIDWIKLEVIKNKQINIKELIPFMRDGWVACDKGGSWCYFSEKPFIKEDYWILDCSCVVEHIDYIELSIAFNIAPAEDWTKSLIRIKGNKDGNKLLY